MPAVLTSFLAVVFPMPWMYVREMTARFCGGMSTPAILAIYSLAVPLVHETFGFAEPKEDSGHG